MGPARRDGRLVGRKNHARRRWLRVSTAHANGRLPASASTVGSIIVIHLICKAHDTSSAKLSASATRLGGSPVVASARGAAASRDCRAEGDPCLTWTFPCFVRVATRSTAADNHTSLLHQHLLDEHDPAPSPAPATTTRPRHAHGSRLPAHASTRTYAARSAPRPLPTALLRSLRRCLASTPATPHARAHLDATNQSRTNHLDPARARYQHHVRPTCRDARRRRRRRGRAALAAPALAATLGDCQAPAVLVVFRPSLDGLGPTAPSSRWFAVGLPARAARRAAGVWCCSLPAAPRHVQDARRQSRARANGVRLERALFRPRLVFLLGRVPVLAAARALLLLLAVPLHRVHARRARQNRFPVDRPDPREPHPRPARHLHHDVPAARAAAGHLLGSHRRAHLPGRSGAFVAASDCRSRRLRTVPAAAVRALAHDARGVRARAYRDGPERVGAAERAGAGEGRVRQGARYDCARRDAADAGGRRGRAGRAVMRG